MLANGPGQIFVLALIAAAFAALFFMSLYSDIRERERQESHRNLMNELRKKDRDAL